MEQGSLFHGVRGKYLHVMWNCTYITNNKEKLFLVVGPLREGAGVVKPPVPIRKLFSIIKKKLLEPHETREKFIYKKKCLLCSVLVNIDQPKNVF